MGRTNTKTTAKTKTIPWDSAAYLKTDKDIANYLEAVFEDVTSDVTLLMFKPKDH